MYNVTKDTILYRIMLNKPSDFAGKDLAVTLFFEGDPV